MSADKGSASTRLLSMKFMQRGAAKDQRKSISSNNDEHRTKRMRLSNGSSAPATPAMSDQQRLQAAQDQEALQRSAVMDKLAAEAGETRWVLDAQEPVVNNSPLKIVYAGFADLDSAEDDNSDKEINKYSSPSLGAGRMVFGQIQKPQSKPQKTEESSDSEVDSESESERDAEENPVDKLVRETARQERRARQARKDAKAEERTRAAVIRHRKHFNLNKSGSYAPPTDADGHASLHGLRSLSGSLKAFPRKRGGDSLGWRR